jgi:hypothetical protein
MQERRAFANIRDQAGHAAIVLSSALALPAAEKRRQKRT